MVERPDDRYIVDVGETFYVYDTQMHVEDAEGLDHLLRIAGPFETSEAAQAWAKTLNWMHRKEQGESQS